MSGSQPPSTAEISDAAGVRAFWFSLQSPGKKDDGRVGDALAPWYRRGAAGELATWAETPYDRLALILLLDQVPRHLFRERAESHATDTQAQALTGRFFADQGWAPFTPLERFYAALPFLHAEDATRQEQVNPVIHACAARIPSLSFMGGIADLYLETIGRFGRFPHRNALLGRASSAAERRFLEEQWFPRRRRITGAAPETGR